MLTTRLLIKFPRLKKALLPSTFNPSYLHTSNKNIVVNNNVSVKYMGKLSCQYCKASTATTTPDGITEKPNADDNGILKRVLKKVGFVPNTKTRLRVSSNMLYESVADKVNYLTFFKDFGLPNTFNSWFLVTELHVWMLLLRSMAEGSESGEDGRFLRNCIVEVMWGDVNTRAKKLTPYNPARTRQQIKELSEQFQAALIAYDEGVMLEDIVLASALWRRFFQMKCSENF